MCSPIILLCSGSGNGYGPRMGFDMEQMRKVASGRSGLGSSVSDARSDSDEEDEPNVKKKKK